MQQVEIIMSWDDGYPKDLKAADLMAKYDIKGIFFIPVKNSEGLSVLNKSEIRELSNNFDIGGHTFNHIDLTTINIEAAKNEINSGKIEIEDVIGREIDYFCFPRGHYNKSIINLVKQAGFKNARSSRLLNFTKSDISKLIVHPNLHF